MTLHLLKKGVQYCISGEYGIGGLIDFSMLNASSYRDKIFGHQQWDEVILPMLKLDVTYISSLPILQAAIIKEVPKQIMKSMIDSFNCVTTKDGSNRYPIDVACSVYGGEQLLQWSKGMNIIISSFANVTNRSKISVAAEYGLHWTNGMDEIVNEFEGAIGDEVDEVTGFHLFALAAAGKKSDLNSIYELARRCPQLVRKNDSEVTV